MHKVSIIAAMVIALNTLSPLSSTAQAASIGDTLAGVLAQSSQTSRLEELLQVTSTLQRTDKEALLSALAQAALQQYIPTDAAGDADLSAAKAVLTQRVNHLMQDYQDEFAAIDAFLDGKGNMLPQTVIDNQSLIGAPENYQKIINMTATAYAPGPLDNGKWNDKTYVGSTVRYGVAAVDPNVIPMGTNLWVEGYGPAIAEDQGSAIKGNRIDLAFDDRQQALDYGIKNVKVYVLE